MPKAGKPSSARLYDLKCEYSSNPLGVEEARPRLSWKIRDKRRGARQEAYQVQVASDLSLLKQGKADLWDSGRVKGDQSIFIPYQGKRLKDRQPCYWRARIWDAEGSPTAWSSVASWEMGLLGKNPWKANWIGQIPKNLDRLLPCPYLRKSFSIEKPIARARLYATGRGLFEIYCNGSRISDDAFTPGWTEYGKRIEYLTYDVTNALKNGANVLGAILGEGWYSGYLMWGKGKRHYGDHPSFMAQLMIDYKDGSSETVVTDDLWKVTNGPITRSDIYKGETYDARKELGEWSADQVASRRWKPVDVVSAPKVEIVSKISPPVRVVKELKPISLKQVRRGVFIFNFGQNMVGYARLRIRGRRGQKIVLRFGEMLQDDGNLYTENLRSADATDTYICKGEGEEVYEPTFTFHGFQYVEVTGFTPKLDSLVGLVLHSDMQPTGSFSCSNRMVNKLQSNILWGQKGNFLDIPTDCPQRDERLGWTGDAQVFATTACFNFDVSGFFARWLRDMELAQLKTGAIPNVIPAILYTSPNLKDFPQTKIRESQGNCAWADAAVICPWVIYQRYGDIGILKQCYRMMEGWVLFQKRTSRKLIRPKTAFGDWLATDAVTPPRAPTPNDMIGTAYFAYTTSLLAKTAAILGKKRDAEKYLKLHDKIVKAFNKEYVSPKGRLAGDTQTGYALALAFDLLPKKLQGRAVERFVQLIEEYDNHLSTGFVGTPLLCPVLTRYGRTDVAYRLLLQETYPGWFYSILQGATTMWERWNSYTKEDGFGNVGMNSFNHYAYGAIGQWMYATVAGLDIDPEAPGFKRILIKPEPGGNLKRARAELETPYGKASSAWTISKGQFGLKVTVPANTSARVSLPSAEVKTLKESGKALKKFEVKNGRTELEISAGNYVFSIKL